ncbi:MAG: hypothetical protein LBS54_04210 [Dysgonamonadaceae bacterium]|jgi:hypothetical protein|nr:hypothetical protein [Dysgonamonadaceae bacterium]
MKRISEKRIDRIREKYPVEFDELCQYNSFEQILGRKDDEYTPDERKRRWNKVMSFNKGMKQIWADCSGCYGCLHLNEKEAWCNCVDFPCTVNPILSFRYGMIGMACMGTCMTKREPDLFDDDDCVF